MRRATLANGIVENNYIFQSTLSMRRATRDIVKWDKQSQISIHALHEESDYYFIQTCDYINAFQSTLSMRRATALWYRADREMMISIHALHEESDQQCAANQHERQISIHALHEESDRTSP